jgi:hypothetical protein
VDRGDILDSQEHQDLVDLQDQITRLPNIQEPLLINEFIQPADEIVEDEEGSDIFESVLERYTGYKEGEVELIEEEDIEEIKVPIIEALKALEVLRLYETQQDDGQESFLCTLDQVERRYLAKKSEGLKQSSINSFFRSIS